MKLDAKQRAGIAEVLEWILDDLPYPAFDEDRREQVYACHLLACYDHEHADLAIEYIRDQLGGFQSVGAWLRDQGIDVGKDVNRLIRHRYEWVKYLIETLRNTET